MNHKSIILSVATFLQCLSLSAKMDVTKPLDDVNTLAGSYAELRPNHFHGGWDFRTGGQENLPIYSVADGYVARVIITPSGYGKMAMIEHPDGITTLYGHLNGFVGKLDSVVRAEQYRQHKYDVKLEFSPNEFPVKKGQQFAISGNTGGSAGPHLHFETRRTSDWLMLNPVEYNSVFGVVDNDAPKIMGLKVYAKPGSGWVVGGRESKYVCGSGGNLRNGSTVNAWGEISFGVKAYDHMTGTWFKYGVRKYRLKIDNVLVSEISLQNFLFADKRAVNSLLDYEQLMKTREYFVKFSKDKANPLPVYALQKNEAVLNVNEPGRIYKIQIEVEDDFGHVTSLNFNVKGVEKEVKTDNEEFTHMFKCGQNNLISADDMFLNLPKECLYTDVRVNYKMEPSDKYFSNIYDFGAEYTPLHVPADLSIKVIDDSLENKKNYVVARLNGKNLVTGVVPSKYINGYMVASSFFLGKFAVYKDEKAPVVFAEHVLKLRQNPVIWLKIHDNLSGINTYNGYIDGKWVLFEYDPKTARILCDLRKTDIAKQQKHTLKVVVTDYCDNAAQFETSFFY